MRTYGHPPIHRGRYRGLLPPLNAPLTGAYPPNDNVGYDGSFYICNSTPYNGAYYNGVILKKGWITPGHWDIYSYPQEFLTGYKSWMGSYVNPLITAQMDSRIPQSFWPSGSLHFRTNAGAPFDYNLTAIPRTNNGATHADGTKGCFPGQADDFNLSLPGWTFHSVKAADEGSHGSTPRCEYSRTGDISIGDEVIFVRRFGQYSNANFGLRAQGFNSPSDYSQCAIQFNHDAYSVPGGIGAMQAIMHRAKSDGTPLRSFVINAPTWAGAVGTGSIGSVVGTSSKTGVLTVTVTSGTINTGNSSVVTGTGTGNVWTVGSQITGTAGGSGTYNVSSGSSGAAFGTTNVWMGKYNDSNSTQTNLWFSDGISATALGGYTGHWDPNWATDQQYAEAWVIMAKYGVTNGTYYTRVYRQQYGGAIQSFVDTTHVNTYDPSAAGFSPTNALNEKGSGIYQFNKSSTFSETRVSSGAQITLINKTTLLRNMGYDDGNGGLAYDTLAADLLARCWSVETF